MSSNKKIALTTGVLILLIIITAASIIAIFAAAQQTVNSEVSVTYKSEYVSGTASAKYYVGEADKEGTAMRVNGEAEGETSIEFNSRNDNQAQTLSPVEKEIKLSEENYFVVFEYYFTNTNSQNDYMATLTTSESNVKNMTITTTTSDEVIDDYSTIIDPVADVTTLNLSKIINANSNGFVYVRVEITNPDNDADFKINFNWDLVLAKPTPEKLNFQLVDGDHYTVSQKDENISGLIVIPAEYGGYPVTEIGGDAFRNNKNITSVVIPKGVTKIGGAAFMDCELLTSVVMPDGLINIGDFAFCGAGLYNVIIPDSVNLIDEYAFDSCPNLNSVTIGEGVKTLNNNAFSECYNLTYVIYNAINCNEEYYSPIISNFRLVENIKLIVGDKVEQIPHNMFYEASVVDLTFGPSLKSISEFGNGFFENEYLTNVTFKGSVKEYLNVDMNLTYSIFSITEDGLNLTTNEGLLTSYNFVEDVPAYAFAGVKSLTKVTFGENVKTIGEYALTQCLGLTSVTFEGNVETIGHYAFLGSCNNLNEVIIESKETYNMLYGVDDEGRLIAEFQSGRKIKVLNTIDATTNNYITSNFTLSGTEDIGGKTYNVYTKN